MPGRDIIPHDVYTYISFGILGLYLTLTLYHYLVYLGRRDDKISLYFVYLLLTFTVLLLQKSIIPSLDRDSHIVTTELRVYFETAGNVLLFGAFMNYAYHTLDLQPLKRLFIAVFVLLCLLPLVVSVVVFQFTGSYQLNDWINVPTNSLGMSIICCAVIYQFFWSKNRQPHRRWQLYVFVSLVFLLLGMLSMPIGILVIPSYPIQALGLSLGCGAMALMNAFALTVSFNEEHDNLRELQQNLEQKVRQRTEALERANAEIEEASQQKTNLFINLAHETKTPLTIISHYLQRYLASVEPTRDLQLIGQSLHKLQRDMVNFLDAEKLERGQVFYDHDQIIDLSELVTSKATIFEGLAQQKGVRLSARVAQHCYVKADPFGMDRVLNNLVDNALKYTPGSGVIEIGLGSEDDEHVITVQDTGSGIPADQLAHIFTPYRQLSHEKRNVQGIGMGLHICSQIVSGIGGAISAQSELDDFTRFTVRLPAHALLLNETALTQFDVSAPTSMAATQELIRAGYLPGRPTILIVEDNPTLLEMLQETLQDRYNVFTAENGRVALERLETIPRPELIISDIMMDEMDGLELRSRLQAHAHLRDVPMIFLTAKATPADIRHGLRRGALDYIAKPFDTAELEAKIDAILRHQLRQSERFTERVDASEGELLAGLSHEISNPLLALSMPLENLLRYLAREDLPDEHKVKLHGYASRIRINVERIRNIIKNLKALYSSGELSTEQLDIPALVTAAIETCQQQTDKQIQVETDLDTTIPVVGNPEAFTQIVTNLVSNAIDAIDGAGHISISLQRQESVPVLTIRDDGAGMSEEQVQRMFDAFYTTKDVGQGMGLGLYIVKQLVQKLGWSQRAESHQGQGTTVCIIL